MTPNWWSYDPVATIYDSVSAPVLFGPIAEDLIALLDLPQGAFALDVGTGSGSGALAAMRRAGPGSVVVGLDPSIEMLRLAHCKGVSQVVRGSVPGLPFADGVFDGVSANFVLNHVASYQTALCDMVRVMRPGARLSVSAWGPLQNEHRRLWREMTESAVGTEALEEALRQAVPWEEWFSDPARLQSAVEDAGLVNVSVQQRVYTTTMAVSDCVAMREISMGGRFVLATLGRERWERFRASVARSFEERFQGPIIDAAPAYLCAGYKP